MNFPFPAEVVASVVSSLPGDRSIGKSVLMSCPSLRHVKDLDLSLWLSRSTASSVLVTGLWYGVEGPQGTGVRGVGPLSGSLMSSSLGEGFLSVKGRSPRLMGCLGEARVKGYAPLLSK